MEVESKEDKTPTEASSKEEVLAFFKWWKEGIFANCFKETTGKELLDFNLVELSRIIDNSSVGTTLYNRLHPKGSTHATQASQAAPAAQGTSFFEQIVDSF
jgi:hypothetical protein